MSNAYRDGKVFEALVRAWGFVLKTAALGSGTDSSQAITLHKVAGTITSSTANLAAATTEAITVTNNYCTADSIVLAMADGGGAGDVVVTKVTPSDGSFIVTTLNADQSNACDAAYKIRFIIMSA